MRGALLLDTHAWAWSLTDDSRLSAAARLRIAAADVVHVSPVSVFEIGQKVRLGKWPEMAPFVEELPDLLVRQGETAAPLDAAICLRAAIADWSHRDPFDRLLAATAELCALSFVSADVVFDGRVPRIW